jgi:hypothetical protein
MSHTRTTHTNPARRKQDPPRYTFGPRSIQIGRYILDRRRRGLCTMAIMEAIGARYPDLSFRDYWGGHALADCIEGDPTLAEDGRQPMSDSPLPMALAFARHGYAVFPLCWPILEKGRLVCSCMGHTRGHPCGTRAAKHPHGRLAPNGLCSATLDTGIIKYWFAVAAPEANLGVVTDRLVVVDVDERHDGYESLAALESEHGTLPRTWRALTGGGGEHVIFGAPEGIEISSFAAETMTDPPLGRGIDVRAKGGYIVAVPSRHICGRSYHWSVDHHPAETPLAPAPAWLCKRLAARRSETNDNSVPVPPDEWAKLVTGQITEYRDTAAAKIAGHLLRRWVDVHVVVSLMRGWNVMHCVPPLTDGELMRILNRIADREATRLERENRR